MNWPCSLLYYNWNYTCHWGGVERGKLLAKSRALFGNNSFLKHSEISLLFFLNNNYINFTDTLSKEKMLNGCNIVGLGHAKN